MAIDNIIIDISCEWLTEDADLDECGICNDIMVTNTNGLYAFANNVLISEEPVIKICNSCFNGIKSDSWQ